MWNLLLNVKGLRYNPSVSLRLPAPFSREPKISLPFRGGEPAKLVEGFFREVFCLVCKFSRKYPILYITPKTDIFLPNAVYTSPCKKIVGFHGDFL